MKSIYTTTHPETGEKFSVEKGGKAPRWITWIDYGNGFTHCGFSSAADHKAAVKAPRSTNPYGKRFAATPAEARGYLGDESAKHAYDIEFNHHGDTVRVHADSRTRAARIAKDAGWPVRSVNMVG